NDPTNSRGGGLDLHMIPQQMIDSVEVSTRPASPIQGSDGLSGTVNISTRPVSGIELRGDLSSQESRSGAVSFGGDLSDNLAASFTFGHDDKTSGVDRDSLRQSYFLGRVNGEPTEKASLDLVLFKVDGEAGSFPEDSGGDRLASIRTPEERDFRREVVGLNAEWDLAERLMIKGSTSWSYHREKTDNPGISAGVWDAVPAVTGERTYKRVDGQLYLLAHPTDQFSVTAGVAYDREKGASEDLIDFGGFLVPADFHLERSSRSVFTELAYQPTQQLTLKAGLRHDMPDTASDESSLSFSAGYLIPQADMTVSANYGEGYKLPSMFALGHSLVGNPDLGPEYSKAIDVGMSKRWAASGVELGLSLFRNEYRDLIDFDPALFTNVNRGLVEVQGVDAQVDWQVSHDVTANLYVTYSDADIVGSSEKLRRRPRWKSGAEVTWSPGTRFTWATSADYTGQFFDSSIPTGMVEMQSFWRLNTAMSWQYTNAVNISVAVKNLLDDDYEESVGFSNGGITATLGMTVAI
ncbi:MAG: TonB-dependent receptor, partial [Gammaproteobacteria bacterium]|nr:TonB-dependent receptor [Gammaproteobacteria bacterium]